MWLLAGGMLLLGVVLHLLTRGRSARSEIRAVEAGRTLAEERGSQHRVLDAEPTGGITDGGAPSDGVQVVGQKEPDQDGLPDTTDEKGMPLENPSG